jgi:hypothetical protein
MVYNVSNKINLGVRMTYQECEKYRKSLFLKLTVLKGISERTTNEALQEILAEKFNHYDLEMCSLDEYMGRKIMDGQDARKEMEFK